MLLYAWWYAALQAETWSLKGTFYKQSLLKFERIRGEEITSRSCDCQMYSLIKILNHKSNAISFIQLTSKVSHFALSGNCYKTSINYTSKAQYILTWNVVDRPSRAFSSTRICHFSRLLKRCDIRVRCCCIRSKNALYTRSSRAKKYVWFMI